MAVAYSSTVLSGVQIAFASGTALTGLRIEEPSCLGLGRHDQLEGHDWARVLVDWNII